MKHGTIVPYGKVVNTPLEPHLQVMVLRNQLQEVALYDIALALRDAVDPALSDLAPGREQRLPAGNGVGADDGVRGGEVEADVLGRAAVAVDQLQAVLLGYAIEVGLVVRCRQAFGEFLPDGGEAVVGLVAAGPELSDGLLVDRFGWGHGELTVSPPLPSSGRVRILRIA